MSIPADAIVKVNPSLLVPGGDDLELNGVFVIDSPLIPPGMVLQFSTTSSVESFFGIDSAVSLLAGYYFRGYTGSPIKPRTLFISRWNATASAPYIAGDEAHDSLDKLKLIDAGSLTVNMGGVSNSMVGIDLTGATSFSAVAAIIEAEMLAVAGTDPLWLASNCIYDGVQKRFVVGSSVTGEAAITPASGTVADALGLSSGDIFAGANVQTPAECMNAIVKVTSNWVTFLAGTTSALTDAQDIDFATWSNSKGVRFLYVLSSSAPDLLEQGDTTNIGAQIQALGLSAVAAEYGGPAYAAFLMGIAASIDYNRPEGVITTAFRSQEGIAFNVTDETEAVQLEKNGFNYYGDWATANDQFRFHYPGQMFGEYQWVDTYLNAIWMNNALQVALMHGISTTGRAPYNEKGYTRVRAWMQDPTQRALSSGVIDMGIVLSESQKADVNQKAGMDIASQLQMTGYFIQIKDPGPIARKNRQSPIINYWYTYGGAIQKLVVASQAIV